MQDQDFATDNEFDTPKSSKFESFFLMASGFAATGLGVALIAAPHFSWTLVRFGRKVSDAGFTNGALIMGGTVLMGMGLLARMFARSATNREETFDKDLHEADWEALMPVLERINQDVSELEHRFTEFAQRETANEGEENKDEQLLEAMSRKQNDSLFRLAASLDQLGARLVKDIQDHFTGVESRFSSLDTALQSFRNNVGTAAADLESANRTMAEAVATENSGSLGLLDELDDSGRSTRAAQPTQPSQPVQPASARAAVAPQPTASTAGGPFEASAPEPSGLSAPPMGQTGFHPAQTGFHPQQQDVLAQTGFQPAQTGFHPTQTGFHPQQEPAPAMPQGQADNAKPSQPGPHLGPSEVGIEGRSEDLESLLPDYRVREAIDDQRNDPSKK